MTGTNNLALPYIKAAQAQKHVTHNEALRLLDTLVQLAVLDRNLGAPPGAPQEGQRWIVRASPAPTGAWAGHGNHIAAWQDGAWQFSVPKTGWLAYVLDEVLLAAWNGTAWVNALAAFQNIPLVGVNTTADATNQLAVKSDAALFSHDDVTPGNGNMQVVINKSLNTGDAGFVFQQGFVTRALLGLLANNDLTLKVSANGAAFNTAMIVNRSTGLVTLPVGGGRLRSTQQFAASGTWTKPAGVRYVLAYVIGAGGGGGGCTGSVGTRASAGGGGAGGLAVKFIDVSAIASEAVTVGTGGAGGLNTGGNGGNGGNSSFGAHCSATGGSGGQGATAGTTAQFVDGGAAGAGAGGDVSAAGNPGLPACRLDASNSSSGAGGGSFLGGGGLARTASANGAAGLSAGAGGSGATTANATARTGGAGADGIVWVLEFE